MGRPVTLFTGQWADLGYEEMCRKAADFGYDGLEVACWGDHMDVFKGATDQGYCRERLEILARHGLKVWAISNHLAGQLVCDLNNDVRSDMFAPASAHGDADKKRSWAVEAMKNTARTARHLGLDTVAGFTGSSIWHMLYSFPPVSEEMIEEGYRHFARMWNPILDVFEECGVRFALEAIGGRKGFGFNFDPSHLHWQGVDPVKFIEAYPDRIYHVHMKDAIVTLDGRSGILGSHLNFGEAGRGWDFRSLGRGEVDFEEIIRALNRIGYKGPLSVEWEDAGMDREHGAREACEFVRGLDFSPSGRAFDAAFGGE